MRLGAAAILFCALTTADRACAGMAIDIDHERVRKEQGQVLVTIDKERQRMSVRVDGQEKHVWAVSTGVGGGPHSGSYRPQRLERKWNSRKYNWAPMPYSIFFDGNYAIHGTDKISRLGTRASKGCVRLHPDHAAILFALVAKRGMDSTRIVVEN